MAARDTMRRHSRPFLDEGEKTVGTFSAAAGMHPMLAIAPMLAGVLMIGTSLPFYAGFGALGVGLALAMLMRNLVVVTTDRNLVVLEGGLLFAYRARRPLARLPADTPVGPIGGLLWGRARGLSEALGTRVWVHRRFRADALDRA